MRSMQLAVERTSILSAEDIVEASGLCEWMLVDSILIRLLWLVTRPERRKVPNAIVSSAVFSAARAQYAYYRLFERQDLCINQQVQRPSASSVAGTARPAYRLARSASLPGLPAV